MNDTVVMMKYPNLVAMAKAIFSEAADEGQAVLIAKSYVERSMRQQELDQLAKEDGNGK